MNDSDVIESIDIQPRSKRNDGVALVGVTRGDWLRLERRINGSLRCRQADQIGIAFRRGERKVEVSVDRELRMFLVQKIQGALPYRLARTGRRSELESDARGTKI